MNLHSVPQIAIVMLAILGTLAVKNYFILIIDYNLPCNKGLRLKITGGGGVPPRRAYGPCTGIVKLCAQCWKMGVILPGKQNSLYGGKKKKTSNDSDSILLSIYTTISPPHNSHDIQAMIFLSVPYAVALTV